MTNFPLNSSGGLKSWQPLVCKRKSVNKLYYIFTFLLKQLSGFQIHVIQNSDVIRFLFISCLKVQFCTDPLVSMTGYLRYSKG